MISIRIVRPPLSRQHPLEAGVAKVLKRLHFPVDVDSAVRSVVRGVFAESTFMS